MVTSARGAEARVQEIAGRVFVEVLIEAARGDVAAGQRALLQRRIVGAGRIHQRVGLAQYRVGLRMRQVRKRDRALQNRVEVRRDRADLLNGGVAAVAAAAPASASAHAGGRSRAVDADSAVDGA